MKRNPTIDKLKQDRTQLLQYASAQPGRAWLGVFNRQKHGDNVMSVAVREDKQKPINVRPAHLLKSVRIQNKSEQHPEINRCMISA